jgi:hypothetical protein
LYVLALGLIVAIAATYVSYRMSQGAPEWYHPGATSAAEREAAARRADDKFLTAISQAADAQAAEIRAKTRPALTHATEPIEVAFTGEELNAFFYKWAKLNQWDQKIGRYLSDPQIVIHDGKLIFAGTINPAAAEAHGLAALKGMVVSLHFRPKLTESGQLDFTLQRVMAGRLPLPGGLWDAQADKLKAFLAKRLPALQAGARIADTGASNGDAIAAAMSQFLLHVLNQKPSRPVVFLPVDNRHGIPVKITAIRIADQVITLTALPLDPAERAALLREIKAPAGAETAMSQ